MRCSSLSEPFAPSLAAGTSNIQAGAFSPLSTTISREDGNQDINNVQALILHNIGNDEMTVGELTARGYYLGSNVSYNVKKMVENNYLLQERSPHDRRSVRVKLYGGALASISDSKVLEGGNAAAVQNADGAWEILQFANAELVDGQTWLLSRLLRGQAGSEFAMASPLPAGAPFVGLGAHMVPIAAGLDALDRPMQLRIVASGRNHDDPVAVALTVTPGNTALLPLSPVHVAAHRAGDGIHISWVRRTRIDGDSRWQSMPADATPSS